MRAESRKKQTKSVEESEGALVTEDNLVGCTVKVVSLPSQMISFQVNCSTPSCTCVCVCLVWSGQVESQCKCALELCQSTLGKRIDVTVVTSFINVSSSIAVLSSFCYNFTFLAACAIMLYEMQCQKVVLCVMFGQNMPLLYLVCYCLALCESNVVVSFCFQSSRKNSRAATWLHVSPYPATHVQALPTMHNTNSVCHPGLQRSKTVSLYYH